MQLQNIITLKEESNQEKLYDLCMIEMLCRGNKEQIKKIVSIFISQVPQSVEEIKTAYSKNDFTTIKKVAHRIRPILGYYAIVKIEKDILRIEAIAETGIATAELQLKINKLEEVTTIVVEKLNADFFA
jgi:HPt (histidine-containing phosphotransfer) domain-containing protein